MQLFVKPKGIAHECSMWVAENLLPGNFSWESVIAKCTVISFHVLIE